MRITLNKWPLLRTASAALLAVHPFSKPAEGSRKSIGVYSDGNTDQLYERFTEETGISVKLLEAGRALIQRLGSEGELTGRWAQSWPAARLDRAAGLGLFREVGSQLSGGNPANLRDPDNRWFASPDACGCRC